MRSKRAWLLAGFVAVLAFAGGSFAARSVPASRPQAGQLVPLGKLDAFWRYSAALGPFHEGGQGLHEVPDYMLKGDFPYHKRPYPLEAMFADHLSMVRILGGFNDEGDAKIRDRDLAYRDANGVVRYRMELLRPRLKPYLDNGYTDLTIVLDNVPWCFPVKPAAEKLGQYGAPADPNEWRDFIRALCREISAVMGPEGAGKLRFRVGTENGSLRRFGGTHDEYVRHYDFTAAAVKEVLPGAKVGCYNISAINPRTMSSHNVRAYDLAEHCFKTPNSATGTTSTPFDWVAYSRYYRAGDDPENYAQVCREVWNEFGRRVPELKTVSREIHEFGFAPWGEAEKGAFASAEPGALGAAQTAQIMMLLREAGINRLWHWGVLDKFRDGKNQLRALPTSLAWLLSILDSMKGGEAYLLRPMDTSALGTRYLALLSKTDRRTTLLVSAYNMKLSEHSPETVRLCLPAGVEVKGRKITFVRLNRENCIHDRIRRDLAGAGQLKEDYVKRPDLLGDVRQMVPGRPAEGLVGQRYAQYTEMWEKSLTLKPFDESIGLVTTGGEGVVVTLRLAAPELLVLTIDE